MVRSVGEQLRQRLISRFRPLHLEIEDRSHRHVGHPGATSTGGHFRVHLVAEAFEGKTRMEQHRLVYAALEGLLGESIHALALKTEAPSRRSGSA